MGPSQTVITLDSLQREVQGSRVWLRTEETHSVSPGWIMFSCSTSAHMDAVVQRGAAEESQNRAADSWT